MGEKKREWEVQRAEERGGEQERYALLEDWERKTTGRSEREGSRERGVKKIKKKQRGRGQIRASWKQRFPVRGGQLSCVC